ncbi:MAG: nitrogenase component 1 [Eubacteriales bacterium]|nr:nitrogenase component 1 [Eubacteriales bacterium]
MKQVSYVISTYTSDVSGVCSALYELGGMVVIHDPSGCNSTYNTHDEPRWFDQDSLIFISGLSQMDAVMGNDDKFIEDILRAAEELSPKFIALVRSPIPLMIGTDFEGIAMEIETRSGIPTFFIPTTGMKSYGKGAGMALELVVRELMKGPIKTEPFTKGDGFKAKESKAKLNLLGTTPLDFSVNDTFSDLCKIVEEEGFELLGSLSYETDYETMMRMPEADVNLVVTSSGLAAAKAMEERFHIPYVVGFPCGSVREEVFSKVKLALEEGKSYFCQPLLAEEEEAVVQEKILSENQNEKVGVLIHEPVIAACLSADLSRHYGKIQPVTMLDCPEELRKGNLLCLESEEEVEDCMKEAAFAVADPMFAPICPKEIPFYHLAHEAFSGRTYRKQIPNLLKIDFL